MMNNHPIKTKGLIAAPFTPFTNEGKLNTSIIPEYANWLDQETVSGAFVCGTTGEGPSLTQKERMDVAEAWVNGKPLNLKVIVHVGHNSLQDAQILASHAQSIGADAIGCMPPTFFQPRNVKEVADWCEEVALAAPQTPFYYYHIPSMSGVQVKVAELMPDFQKRIPAFAGVKFTYEDLDDFSNCLQFDDGRYDILFGRDEKLLSALQIGATGAVGSTYNFAAPIYHRIISARGISDLAQAVMLQEMAVRMIDICIAGTWHPIAAFKTIMELAGFDCGPTRPPIPDLSPQEKQSLNSQLKEFFDAGLLHRHEPIQTA